MCRIDGPFGSHSLEEQNDPTKRFLQALDESGTAGVFRDLLGRHFATTWSWEFGSIERIEKALTASRHSDDLAGKVSLFVQTLSENHVDWFLNVYFGVPVVSLVQGAQKRYPARFAFAEEVASSVFPESPFGFYRCFKNSISVSFEAFVLLHASAYYGMDCHLTSLLFNDKHLASLGSDKRKDLLWTIFKHLTQWDCTFSEHLMNLHAWNTYASVPTQETLRFSQAFTYLEGWIAADSQMCDFAGSYDLFYEFYEFLLERGWDVNRQNGRASDDQWGEEELEHYTVWAQQWLETKRHEIIKAWCSNVSVEELQAEELERWAYYAYEIYLPLWQDLSVEHAEALISHGIQKDFERWLKPDISFSNILDHWTKSHLWYVSSHRDLWKSILIGKMETFSFAEKAQVFGRSFGGSIALSVEQDIPQFIVLSQEHLKPAEECHRNSDCYVFSVEQEDRDWWDSFLRNFPDEEGFPQELYPSWTIDKLTRFGYGEPLAVNADKSLGIVRSELSRGGSKVDSETVEKLLDILQQQAPEKAMRSYLMLLRFSPEPFATEKLNHDRESLCPLAMSEIVKKFRAAHFQNSPKNRLPRSERESEELQLMFSLRTWIAQYCLSRLKLRKGERANGDNYAPEQVTEPSPIWRQAYLKALTELGVDLKGNVHRTVNFTRKSDPDENVCAVAKECYKAVRREHNKSESVADIRRGLTAAHWWLLLAQRQALGAHIDYEEARLTRRRLLRRP